jgi:hypothetical protein
MPLFQVNLRFASDIQGQPARKWSNTFYMNGADTLTTAANGVDLWENYLRPTCRERVWCYEVYVRDLVAGTDVFITVPIPEANQRGTQPTPASTEPYLPKACIAVTLAVSGSRPSRKFYRVGLYETDVVFGTNVLDGIKTAITTAFDAWFLDNPGILRDPDDQPLLTVSKMALTTREFGRTSTADVPLPPPFG